MIDPRPSPEYHYGTLRRDELHNDPFEQFNRWHAEIVPEVPIPDAATLATVDADGVPDARVVLIRGTAGNGFLFFTDYASTKGVQLAHNPAATLLFFWDPTERQVRVRGRAQRVAPELSDQYFAQRPRGSRLAAVASSQSAPVANRAELERRVAELERQYDGQPIPRPADWGGYKIVPDSFEFWQGRASRLHDRFLYTQDGTGGWSIQRLAP
ncbi:MAG: pyridoxamine 5'-phosphate oxidase [Planctomycetota bacterium]|nr:pyridoxamine 5'-phosphate oxidase [Planctomycetota bacterium]